MAGDNSYPLLQIPASLTFVGTFLVIIVIISSNSLRNKIHVQLVLFVAISDFMTSVVYLFGDVNSGTPFCWLQGLVSNSFTVASVFWSTAMAYQILLIVYRKSLLSASQTTVLHFLCWGLPVLLTLLVLTTNTYGREDDAYSTGCFITQRRGSPQDGQLLWEIFALFFWLWLCVILIVYFYIKIGIRLYQMDVVSVVMSKAVYNLFFYPIILIFCWTINTYLILSETIDPQAHQAHQASPAWGVLSVVFPVMQGAFSSIVFFTQSGAARQQLLYLISCGQVVNPQDLDGVDILVARDGDGNAEVKINNRGETEGSRAPTRPTTRNSWRTSGAESTGWRHTFMSGFFNGSFSDTSSADLTTVLMFPRFFSRSSGGSGGSMGSRPTSDTRSPAGSEVFLETIREADPRDTELSDTRAASRAEGIEGVDVVEESKNHTILSIK